MNRPDHLLVSPGRLLVDPGSLVGCGASSRAPRGPGRTLVDLSLAALMLLIASAGAETVPLAAAANRNVQFTNITTEHGLSAEFVHDVVQDGRGYMWFATQAGLNRYDGHEVRVYEHRPNHPSSLSHSFIWSLHVDLEGHLWVGTDRGLNRYDYQTDSFLRTPIGGTELRGVRVRKVTQDRHGWFWIGTLGNGIFGIDPDSGRVFKYPHDPAIAGSLPSDNVIDILEDRRGQIWVGTDGGGLARLDRATNSFVVYTNEPDNPRSLSDNHIRALFEDSSGRFWIGTGRGGLNMLNPSTGRFTRYQNDPDDPESIGGGQVPAIFEDNRGTLWIGTESGLCEWQPELNRFVQYGSVTAGATRLINNRINALFQDASGVLWLATHGGVSAWNYFSDTFSYYSSAEGYLSSDLVTAIDESRDGAIWVATYGGGLSRVMLAADEVQHFRHNKDDSGSLPDDRVMAVLVDDEDTVWVGTRNGGLSRMGAGTERFEHFLHDPSDPRSISGNAISRIFSASDGLLWVGVFDGGLSRMDPANPGVFDRFMHDPENDETISGDRVLALAEDSGGGIWVGTEGAGLNRYDPATGVFLRVDIENVVVSDGSDPVSGTPWEIHESSDGSLWIGTLGQGLLRWNKSDRDRGLPRFEPFGVTEGLASEIYGIVEGGAGELWLSSSRGLFQFEPRQRIVRKFDRNNGLRSNEFNQGARLRSRSGRVLFGGTSGLLGFYPGELPTNSRPPAISLEAHLRTGDVVRSGDTAQVIELNYLDSFVSFEFVALDFVSSDKNQYRYRLMGFDNEWTEVRSRNAIYTSLPPGVYDFEVQASNNDGIWNRQGPTMRVHVIPPPWDTFWAYCLYVAAFAGVVAWYLMRQKRKRVIEAAMRSRLEELVSERTTELGERNDELQALNSRLEEASVTDALTGLHNRRYVDQFIEGEISMVRRCLFGEGNPEEFPNAPDSPRLLFVMMIDLDGFKLINDTFGHHAGDKALIEVKERLVECCRLSDAIVRWGGDEFMILGHAQSFEGAVVLAEKVRKQLSQPRYDVGSGNTGRLSGSIGVSAIPFVDGNLNTGTWEQIVGVADQAAYLAKSNGRNAWVSIRGTELTVPDDFLTIKERLPEMRDLGKVVVNSSVPNLRLVLEEPLQRVGVR